MSKQYYLLDNDCDISGGPHMPKAISLSVPKLKSLAKKIAKDEGIEYRWKWDKRNKGWHVYSEDMTEEYHIYPIERI